MTVPEHQCLIIGGQSKYAMWIVLDEDSDKHPFVMIDTTVASLAQPASRCISKYRHNVDGVLSEQNVDNSGGCGWRFHIYWWADNPEPRGGRETQAEQRKHLVKKGETARAFKALGKVDCHTALIVFKFSELSK